MKTIVFETIVTAKSSICHNGGERNGTIVQLRREKFVQPSGNVVEIPVISGNSIRGKLRDLSAIEMLNGTEGRTQVDAETFHLLFTGGTLSSTGEASIDVDKVRKLRAELPMLAVLGGAVGNFILPGKASVGKMIPVCTETAAFIPEKFHDESISKTIWEYCQIENYTRKDDAKDENLAAYLAEGEKENAAKAQMMYQIETIAAGTKFYWCIALTDPTDGEVIAFMNTIKTWLSQPTQLGGNGRVGHGAISIAPFTERTTTEIKNSGEFVNVLCGEGKPNAGAAEKLKNGIKSLL